MNNEVSKYTHLYEKSQQEDFQAFHQHQVYVSYLVFLFSVIASFDLNNTL